MVRFAIQFAPWSDPEVAEDIVQDALVIALEKRFELPEDDHQAVAVLMRTIRNVGRNRRRWEHRHYMDSTDDVRISLAAEGSDPWFLAWRIAVARDLEAERAALTPAEREVFALRQDEDLSLDQIAERRGCSVKTAKELHRRARANSEATWPHSWLGALLSAVLLAACGSGSQSGDVRTLDSPDGVTPPTLTTSDVPDFSLSERGPGLPSAIFNARHGVALQNGMFVVGHAGPQLLYIDSTGAVIHVTAEGGQNPVHPGSIGGLFSSGNQVAVWDPEARRLFRYSERGEYIADVALPTDRTALLPVRGYMEGIGVVTSVTDFRVGQPDSSGQRRQYQVFDDAGNAAAVILGYPEPPPAQVAYRTPEGATGSIGLPLGCMARPLETVLGAEVIAVDASAGVIAVLDAFGGSRELYEAPVRPVVSAEMIDSLRGFLEASNPDHPAPSDTIASALRRVGSVGDPLPAWTGVIPDPTGRLWLRRDTCFGASEPQVFDIIDRQGQPQATVLVPSLLTVRAVHGHRMLVVRRDELGVEHIEQYRTVP